MKINKITTGFVIQQFDTDLGRYVSQNFTAGDPVEYETPEGEPVDPSMMEGLDGEPYLPFDMVQPLALESVR